MKSSPVILLCGCPLNTGNNGVSALAVSTIQNLISIHPDCHIIIQHNTGKEDHIDLQIGARTVRIETVFFHPSKSFSEYKGLKLASLISYFLPLIPRIVRRKLSSFIPLFSALDRADMVLDISGGDSFTSIYGSSVFESITQIKQIVIRMHKPLVLLPQSYGDFELDSQRKIVAGILNNCELISCRDQGGPDALSEFVSMSNRGRFVSCPDLAFSLGPDKSQNFLVDELLQDASQKSRKIIGFNISGLLYSPKINFDFKCDYEELVKAIIKWIINDLEAQVVLVPHVVGTEKTGKGRLPIETTDTHAINSLLDSLDNKIRKNVHVLPDTQDPRVIKGMIGSCDYFIGSRMHACIAAISQAVPTTCLAYSDKFTGVMQLAGFKDTVVEMREMDLVEVMQVVKDNYFLRSDRQTLVDQNMSVKNQISGYFNEHLDCF